MITTVKPIHIDDSEDVKMTVIDLNCGGIMFFGGFLLGLAAGAAVCCLFHCHKEC